MGSYVLILKQEEVCKTGAKNRISHFLNCTESQQAKYHVVRSLSILSTSSYKQKCKYVSISCLHQNRINGAQMLIT
jgi:hypothetical protein